jgi:uncharacterized protein (DUF4213/DUF364 family)
MWELYDALIEGIDADATADFFACGMKYSFVRSGAGTGIGSTSNTTRRPLLLPNKKKGMPLRALAECIKSWNFAEASLGLAAINAWYNEKERVRGLGLAVSDALHTEDRAADPFIALQREIRGKRVAVVRRFPYIDRLFAPVCELSVIGKFNPEDDDYPEQAAEYILPACDYAFLSSCTLAEKTLPRYLALAKGAHVTLVGPGAPITPILHDFGVDETAGLVVKAGEAAEAIVLGNGGKIYAAGQKVNLKRS